MMRALSAPQAADTPERRRMFRLGDPSLFGRIRGALVKRGAPKHMLEDLTSKTLVAACGCPYLPDEDEGFRQYVCGMARRIAGQFRRKTKAEPEMIPLDELTYDEPRVEAQAEIQLTAKRVVADMKPSQKKAWGWFLRHVAGDSYELIAGEEGLPYKKVWNAVENLRAQLEKRANGTAVIVAILLMLWAFVKMIVLPTKDVANPNVFPETHEPAPHVVPPPVPTGAPVGEVQTPGDPGEIRKAAFEACQAGKWGECLAGLNEAAAIDPAGDRTAEARAARKRAVAGVEAGNGKVPR